MDGTRLCEGACVSVGTALGDGEGAGEEVGTGDMVGGQSTGAWTPCDPSGFLRIKNHPRMKIGGVLILRGE